MSSSSSTRLVFLAGTLSVSSAGPRLAPAATVYSLASFNHLTLWIALFTVFALAISMFYLYWQNSMSLVRDLEAISTAMKCFVTNGFQEYSVFLPENRSSWLTRSLRPFSTVDEAVHDLAANADLIVSAIAESKRGMLEREKNHLLWIEFLSHDLASPLARISKRLNVLEYGESVTAAMQERFFAMAHLEITQLVEMLDSVSQIASLESNAKRHFLEVSLEPLLQEVIDVFEFEACEKGIRLKRDLDVDVIVRVEKTLIRRALGNLISNSIRYTPDGGEVSIHAEENGRTIKISVRDSGTGIPAHELSRIFEAGFRGDGQSRPAKFGPRGLGLALVQKVAEMHHGCVEVMNLDAMGTEFVITLPIQ